MPDTRLPILAILVACNAGPVNRTEEVIPVTVCYEFLYCIKGGTSALWNTL
jgi:hypothetical protein